MKTQESLELLEPQTLHFIEELNSKGGVPIYKMTPADARKVLEDLQSGKIDKIPCKIEDITIKTGPSGKLVLTIYRPQNVSGKLHPVIYCHGGGWILGSKNTHDRLLRELCTGGNCAAVFVNYTPAPEAKFPTQNEEAFAAAKYIYEHGKELNLDTSKFVVAGDSVGGNMTIALTLMAKERGGPKFDCQLCFYPVTDASMNTESYHQYADGPWLTKKAMEWFWNAYAPNASDRKNITASPLQATLDQLKGLPPALIITDENDVLRDEGEAYAHRLMQAGVPVSCIRCVGACHDFMMLNPLAKTPPCRTAIATACALLRKVFSS